MNDLITKKFKAWDKQNNCWVNQNYIFPNWANTPYFNVACIIDDVIELRSSENFIWVEFTGWVDINNKEIFEGDCFGKFGGDTGKPDEWEIHATVYFDDDLGAFCVELANGSWEYLASYLSNPKNQREIIGNKFEGFEIKGE